MLIVDAHLDLAYNALNFNRNLRLELEELRASEPKGYADGVATVTIPELKKGGIGLVFGTLFTKPATSPIGDGSGKMAYRNSAEANKNAMSQLDYYHRLADEDETLRLVGNLKDLDQVVESHQSDSVPLLGIVPLMEGADPIREPEEGEYWYERGLRIIGLAWDNTRYSAGAWRGGNDGLSKEGYQLMEMMAEYGIILDLTHMSEKATFEALDRYEGPIVATHCNARALVPGERQLSDTQIRLIGERKGVIGTVLYNSFLRPNHRKGEPKHRVTLDHVVGHIDHICQILGDANHVGIGSDFDGGFGVKDIPAEMDSTADLGLIGSRLFNRGYQEDDVAKIMGKNWIALLRRAFS